MSPKRRATARKPASKGPGRRPRKVLRVIALTMGDPSGVGPEVLAEALATKALWRGAVPLVFGDLATLERAARSRRVRLPKLAPLDGGRPETASIVSAGDQATFEPGKPDAAGARLQLRALEMACDAIARGEADALSTAPVSKAQIASTGISFSGHTEFLAERFKSRTLMMMAGPRLRVAVATTHVPLAEVSHHIDRRLLVAQLILLDAELKRRFGVKRPRIAVSGLNPHAGEGGQFGREEIDVIAPAVAVAKAGGMTVEGPVSADGLFPRALRKEYDAVFAMYHDQGLIPAKLVDFESTVNVTLGLPFVRTSPDHGVAYELAGKKAADSRSMIAAVRLAIELSEAGGAAMPAPAAPEEMAEETEADWDDDEGP